MTLNRFRKRTEYDLEKSKKRDNFIFLNETHCKKNQIVIAGDSITEIFNMDFFNDYMIENGVHIYNRGISGDTSDRFLERIEETVLSIEPSVLFMLIGTNDLTLINDVDYVYNNIISSVEKALVVCDKLIIQSVLPVDSKNHKKNKNIIELNSKLKSFCNSSNVIYLDTYSLLLDENGGFNNKYTYDGLHPNAKGFEIMAREILNLIKE